MLSRLNRIASHEMVEAAQLFYTTDGRAANDKNNRIRENFLATVLDTTHTDQRFNTIKTKWTQFLLSIDPSPTNPTNPTIKTMAGRMHHYDFAICFPSDTIKVEFKHNAKSISRIPQFLSLPTKNATFMSVDYAGFFYDTYLPQLLDADPILSATLPDRKTYLEKVFNCNYDANPFFRMAKGRDVPECNKSVKDRIVKASITDYLKSFGPTTDKEKLSNLFHNTQDGKIYALWDPATETFYKNSLTQTDLTIISVGDIKNGNTLIAKSATKEFHMLLRWKNHSGVLFPAWQIKCLPPQKAGRSVHPMLLSPSGKPLLLSS